MSFKALLAGGIFAICLNLGGANAAPVTMALSATAEAPHIVLDQVQYRRGFASRGFASRGYARPRYGRGWGVGPWIGLGAAVAAGAIIYNSAYLPRRGYYYDTYAYDGPYYYPEGYSGDRRELCARYFKSFEWESGMYTTYSGVRRLCPYLRD